MKRWIIYLAVLALCGTSSTRATDIGKLAPVEVVWLTEKAGFVYLETDTGDVGVGEDVQSALRYMKSTAPGTIFLETADYLIVEHGREVLLQQVYDVLHPSCKVCIAEKMPDMEKVAEFLSAHEPCVTLRQHQVEMCALPIIREHEGRFRFVAE